MMDVAGPRVRSKGLDIVCHSNSAMLGYNIWFSIVVLHNLNQYLTPLVLSISYLKMLNRGFRSHDLRIIIDGLPSN